MERALPSGRLIDKGEHYLKQILIGLLIYWVLISLISVVVCGWDKRQAKKGRRRVPENTLLLLCALGGSAAFWVAMYRFHHKTRKPKFYLGVPAILLAQVAIAIWLLVR